MRRRFTLRRRFALSRAAVAVPMLAAPALGAGIAYAASPHGAASGSHSSIHINVRQRRVPYGQDLTVTGSAPSGAKGQSVVLDFQRVGSAHWREVASTTVGNHARFHFHNRFRSSGRVRVTGQWQARQASSGPGSGGASAPASDTPSRTRAASRPHRITIVASLHVGYHASNDYGGHVITVPGRLQPGNAGRRVRLGVFSNGHWHTGAVARTGSQGRFRLRFTPHSRWQRLRVRFGGDRTNAATGSHAGTVTKFSRAVASWYEDSGSTACGTHAHYGVANVSLPCGTKVKFAYHGRTVTATVDDRGPYVGGRTWDLNQNTAGALGFDGVDDVWASR
ncbi:MAG: septal ring lytic transglycosylase RlpA family protein [Solirubrobacteraceae bacterium]